MYANYVAARPKVFRADTYIASYSTTTTDHYPVFTHYNFGRAAGRASVTGHLAQRRRELGGRQQPHHHLDVVRRDEREAGVHAGRHAPGATIIASTAASAGSYAWTVPNSRHHRGEGARDGRANGAPSPTRATRPSPSPPAAAPGQRDPQRDPGQRAGLGHGRRVRGAGQRGRHRGGSLAGGRSRTRRACATPSPRAPAWRRARRWWCSAAPRRIPAGLTNAVARLHRARSA